MISPENPKKLTVRLSMKRERNYPKIDRILFSVELFSREVLTENDFLSGRLLRDLKEKSVTTHVPSTEDVVFRRNLVLKDNLYSTGSIPGYHVLTDKIWETGINSVFSAPSEIVADALLENISNGHFKTQMVHEGGYTHVVHSWKAPISLSEGSITKIDDGSQIIFSLGEGKPSFTTRRDLYLENLEVGDVEREIGYDRTYLEEWEKYLKFISE